MIQQSYFDDLLLKLKPKWGDKKIASIKALYELGDKEKKERLQKIIALSAKSELNDSLITGTQILLPPNSKMECKSGDINLGNVCYGYNEDNTPKKLYPLNLSFGELTQHMIIAGQTGQGKTTLAYNAAIDLAKKNPNISIVVIDFNRSWRSIFSLPEKDNLFLKNARLFTIGRDDIAPFAGNMLFSPPPGIPLKHWIGIAISKPLEKTLLSGHGTASLLEDNAEAVMDEFQDKLKKMLPNFEDIQARLQSNPYQARELLWSQSANRIAKELTRDAVNNIFNSRHLINIANTIIERKGITILELDLLIPPHIKELFAEIFFWYLYLYNLTKGEAEPDTLRTVLFVEEAMNVLTQTAHSKRIGTNILHTLIREARKFGIGLVFIAQEPSELPNALISNAKTTIMFASKSERDIRAAAGSLFLKPHEVVFIDLLTRGYAIAKISGRTSNLLLRIPPPPFDRRVTDDELKTLAEKWQHQN